MENNGALLASGPSIKGLLGWLMATLYRPNLNQPFTVNLTGENGGWERLSKEGL